MDAKRNLAIILSSIVIVISAVSVAIFSGYFDKDNNKETDAMRFKNEYEALNDTIRESDGAKYNSVRIDENNPFVYIDVKEALEIIDNKDAIIYVGAPWCPWCRNAISVMIDVAKQVNVKEIYYLDLDRDKSIWEVEDGKAVKKVDGTDYYYQLLEKLKDNLRDYTLTLEDGKTVETGEKRIYMPYVFGIKNGRVVAEHTGTVDLDDEQTKYDYLTEDQEKELYDIYKNIFELVNKDVGGSCDKDGECD